VTDIQLKIRVLKLIIGYCGDMTTGYINISRICGGLANILIEIDKATAAGDEELVADLTKSAGTTPDEAYNTLVLCAGKVLGKDKSELEREAFHVTEVDKYLEGDGT